MLEDNSIKIYLELLLNNKETLWYVILDKLEKSNKTVAKFTYI
jgi:hypothetical protein